MKKRLILLTLISALFLTGLTQVSFASSLPYGHVDVLNSNRLAGWAKDNNTAGRIKVHIYTNGHYYGQIYAQSYRADVGRHAFDIRFRPPLRPGTKVDIYAINYPEQVGNPRIGGGRIPSPSPAPRPVHSRAPYGRVDVLSSNILTGWAKDPDTRGRIKVHVYVNGRFYRETYAQNYRSDVGRHSFKINFRPSLRAGTRVDVYAINYPEQTGNPRIGGGRVPAPVRRPAPRPVHSRAPYGHVDVATVNRVSGWAKDPDTRGRIKIHVYVNGSFYKQTYAQNYRSDVGRHAYTVNFLSLLPTGSKIDVYAINYPEQTGNRRIGSRRANIPRSDTIVTNDYGRMVNYSASTSMYIAPGSIGSVVRVKNTMSSRYGKIYYMKPMVSLYATDPRGRRIRLFNGFRFVNYNTSHTSYQKDAMYSNGVNNRRNWRNWTGYGYSFFRQRKWFSTTYKLKTADYRL